MAMTTFKLYGVLGRRFGKVHKLDCFTPGEGITGLCVKLPGLQDFLMSAHLDNMMFKVRKGDHTMTGYDELGEFHGNRVVTIAPVMTGAK